MLRKATADDITEGRKVVFKGINGELHYDRASNGNGPVWFVLSNSDKINGARSADMKGYRYSYYIGGEPATIANRPGSQLLVDAEPFQFV